MELRLHQVAWNLYSCICKTATAWSDRLLFGSRTCGSDAAQECANRCVAKYGVKILGIYIRVSDGKAVPHVRLFICVGGEFIL